MLVTVISVQSQCILDEQPVWTEFWESCTPSANPNPIRGNSIWIMYEFDKPHNITSSHFWNANLPGQSGKGIKTIIVDYSQDGQNWQSLGQYTLPKASELSSYTGVSGPNLNGIFIKKLLLTVLSTYDNNSPCAVIGEIKLDIDSSICHDVVDECGVCGGIGKRLWYIDRDKDGLGSDRYFTLSCTKPNGYVSNNDDQCDNGAIAWPDISSLFATNGCLGCHAEGIEEGGLNLSSYESISLGGDICGANILTGNTLTGIISISNFNTCGTQIPFPSMNERVGNNFDNDELMLLQDWIDGGALESCQCISTDRDEDNDGICDAQDICPAYDDKLIGTACDDNNICTENDLITVECKCQGTIVNDYDNDGVCDALDVEAQNPCTADGVVDGYEPISWKASPSNDCDLDGFTVSQNDQNDFDRCIDSNGFKAIASCICEINEIEKNGGELIFAAEGIAYAQEAAGLPNNQSSGFMFGSETMILSYRHISIQDTICVAVGFNDPAGIVNIQIQGIEYQFKNKSGNTTYEPQLYCIKSLSSGSQQIQIKDEGPGSIKVDGSYYYYCPCSPGDPEFNSPKCSCENRLVNPGNYISHIGVGANPSFADGIPDGVFTGNIKFQDTLHLSYQNLTLKDKICITTGFSADNGVMEVQHGNTMYLFRNDANIINFMPQEFCFIIDNVSPSIFITDSGPGYFQVDGSFSESCPDCFIHQNDSDNDGVCDSNDICPLSLTDDSDYDGICDNLDKCQGYNDNIDTDFDGIPNGCDICIGFDDTLDSDNDGVPDGCDRCANYNDSIDSDNDMLPDKCDPNPCPDYIFETNFPIIDKNKTASKTIRTNGLITNSYNSFYKADYSIELMNNFEVKLGSTFTLSMRSCTNQ